MVSKIAVNSYGQMSEKIQNFMTQLTCFKIFIMYLLNNKNSKLYNLELSKAM